MNDEHASRAPRSSFIVSNRIFLRIFLLQLYPQPRPRHISMQRAVARGDEAVEEHGFDSGVIEEVLEVAHRQERAAEGGVEGRGAMRGERDALGLAQRRGLEEAGD